MKTIGLTGGIGSGKSLVASVFEKLGFLVYKADERSKYLLANDATILAKVKEAFGDKVLDKTGLPDRKKLATLVFSKPRKLETLNAILHPPVAADFDHWLSEIRNHSAAPYAKSFVFKEAAILFEAGTAATCDKVIEVYAPQALRLERVCIRDQVKARDVLARMDRQWPESRKVLLADFVIYNDGEHPILPQVLAAVAWLEKEFNADPQKA